MTAPQGRVADWNNATEANLDDALARLEADRRWPWKRLRGQAHEIAADCLRLLLREVDGAPVLLPGAQGFDGGGIST